jgi:hypothetical protein
MAESPRVGIMIPTMNRADFLARELAYYGDVGSRNTIYVGDLSETSHADQTLKAIGGLKRRVNIVYLRIAPASMAVKLRHRTVFGHITFLL